MISHIIGATTSAPSTSAANYNAPTSAGTGSWNATEALRAQVVPHAMTVDQLRVTVTNAPGVAANYAFTLVKNGGDTGLTCTIGSDATMVSNQDLTHTVTLAAGDLISFKSAPFNLPGSAGTVYWSIRQTATSLFGVIGSNIAAPTSGTNYMSPQNRNLIASTDALGQMIMPTAGVFSNLYLNSRAAPGAGTSWTVTMMLNGAAQTLSAAIADAATANNDTAHSITVAAGDTVSLKIVVAGTPGATNLSYAMSFDPTNDGESFLSFTGNGVGASTSATNFNQPHGADATWNATENTRYSFLPATTLKAFYVATSVSPGVSPKAYAYTYRNEVADTAATVTINDASTVNGSGRWGSITGLSVIISNDNKGAIKSVPASTPSSVFTKTSLLFYIAPAFVKPFIVSQAVNRASTY